MINSDYWEKLDVHCKYILENWESREKRKLKNYLAKFDEKHLLSICELLELFPDPIVSKGVKEKLVELIMTSQKSKELGLLKDFSNFKLDLISDYYERLVTEGTIKIAKRGNAFLELIEIYHHSQSELSYLLTHSKWVRNASFAVQFKGGIPLRQEYITEFEERIQKFIQYLRKGNYKRVIFKFKGKLTVDGKIIFAIDRQVGDKLMRNIDKNKRNKLASDLLISFDCPTDKLEIRCKDPHVVKKSADAMQTILGIKFSKYMPEVTNVNNNKFTNYIEEIPDEVALKIVGVTFKNSKLSGTVPLAIPQSYRTDSIAGAIVDLKTRNIVDPQIINISSISLSFEDKIREIMLERDGTYFYFTLKPGSRTGDAEKGRLSLEFTKIFGFGLNEKFSMGEEQSIEERLNTIISRHEVDYQDEPLMKALSFLEERKIIKKKEKKLYQCTVCRTFNSQDGTCRHCTSSPTSLVEQKILFEIPRISVVNYLCKLLDKEIKAEKRDVTRTWSRSYQFLKLTYKQMPIYLFCSDSALSAKLISHFQRSGLPIIIVSYGVPHNKEINELSNFAEVELVDLITEKMSKEEFNRIIKDKAETSGAAIAGNARESIRKLKIFTECDQKSFEDDVVNVFQYIFKSVEKWGKEKTGVEIPEGLAYVSFENGVGVNNRTFGWDCKFSKKESYDLTMGEKRKAESYIRKLNKSKEVKEFSVTLSAFVLVINKASDDQFRKLGQYVIPKIRSWKGNIVLIKLEELLSLYSQFDRSYTKATFDMNEFKSRFCSIMMGKKGDRIVIIEKADIDYMFSTTKDE
ncbi:hypothetical protein HYV86_06930 [Candidatus Woesearchaeota archaeon]|nr:hypothetical protein [Candidatus Woesearchaeota archaeon]